MKVMEQTNANKKNLRATHMVVVSGVAKRVDLRYTSTGVGMFYLTLAGETLEEGRVLPYYLNATILSEEGEEIAERVGEGKAVVVRGVLNQYRKEGEAERTSIQAGRIFLTEGSVNDAGRLENGINSVLGYARLVKEPTSRTLEDGTEVATARVVLQGNGENSIFLNLEAWGPVAELLAKCEKGTGLMLDGRLRSSSWVTSDGTKRYETRLVARKLLVAHEAVRKEKVGVAPTKTPSPADIEEFEELPF